MFLSRVALLGIVLLLLVPCSWAQGYRPITALGRDADLIAFATVEEILQPTNPDIVLRLRVLGSIKGPAPLGMVTAMIPAKPPRALGAISIPANLVGITGLWFLKSGAGAYRILPRSRAYDSGDLFLPVRAVDPADRPGLLDSTLLELLVHWYQSLDKPSWRDDAMLRATLDNPTSENLTPNQVLSAVAPFIKSSSPMQRAHGLAAALRVGSRETLRHVIDELPALRSNPGFDLILAGIGWFPKDPDCVPLIHRLLERHRGTPGVESAAVSALWTSRSKAILPDMASLLSSKDPGVQMSVAGVLGRYTMFADAKGEFNDGGPMGPFATEGTRAHMPRSNSSLTPPEYAQWWQSWWLENRARLGFPSQ